MNRNRCIIIHFDYGGYYSNTGGGYMEWIQSEDQIYTLVMKTSIEEVTYSELFRGICKKMKRDEDATKLKFSYTPKADSKQRPSFIEDDGELFGYITSCPHDKSGSILHVEVVEDAAQTEESEEVVREDLGSAACVNDGIVNVYGEDPMEHDENVPHDDELVNVDNSGLYEYNQLADYVDGGEEEPAREVYEHVNVEWEDGVNVTLDQEFHTKGEVQDIVEKAAHKKCFQFDIIKSEPKRYVVKCREAENGCKWLLRAAVLKGQTCYSIRTHNKMHTCSPASSSSCRKNRRKGTRRLVASVVKEDYPGEFKTPGGKVLVGLVHRKIGIEVSYSTAYRGRKEAASYVRGSPEESYNLVYSFMHNLELANRGSVTHVEVDEEKRFKYLFFGLGACIDGFRAMRKVLVMDATHLKTIYGGVLIIATAQDPERHHYPIAFGVADGEKDASWSWFLERLKTIVPDSEELVFLTDRNQSIIKSVSELFPLSRDGYCMYHLSQNVKVSVHHVKKEVVATKFMDCAKAYTEAEFKELYIAFRKRYPSAAEYLDRSTNCSKWARCYFPGDRYNLMSTNAAESINGVLVHAREYSMLPMIDFIVTKISEWFNKHRKSAAEVPASQKLVPSVASLINERLEEATRLEVTELNSFHCEYTVLGLDGITYVVDLDRKTCSCRRYDIDKYTCVHALAANRASTKEVQVHELCSKYYWMEQWALAYCGTVYQVPHMTQWVVPSEIQEMSCLPPLYITKKGRKGKVRYPSLGEYGRGKSSRRGSSSTSRGSDSTGRGSTQSGQGLSQSAQGGRGGRGERGGRSERGGRGPSFQWFQCGDGATNVP